ncbi:MAG TPA: helix-turn-helix transcriptional regulator [Bdellovibrio sp.]|uniref:helix-turn-helix domain-containing protein n=1 Tax=Bdellovibrio sp. TaxID=28201 RepID=UPI002EEEBFC4
MAEKVRNLAQFLKERRVAAGFSQKEVADHLGYDTAQFISNWERGISSPPISVLKKLAEFYRISAEKLFDVVLEEEIRQTTVALQRKFKTSR